MHQALLVQSSDWHSCKTTHCRAGRAIHVAGDAGYALEKEVGSWMAGALIYQESRGDFPDFYADTIEAMEDIEKCATVKP